MHQHHQVKLIVNPNADLGRAWRTASDLRFIVDEFGGADWSGTVYPTHAIELARQAAEQDYRLVIAVGGDGTVHEVINGLMQATHEHRPLLGVVPMGSGNDFAKAIGIPRDPIQALRRIFTGQPKRIDIGLLSDDHGRKEYWNNTLGIGFDATVTIRSRRFTYLRGFPLYLAAVLQTIALNYDPIPMRLATDQENWEDQLLMLVVCNGPREGGGFLIAPEARPDDGVYHYMAAQSMSRPMMLRLLPEVMRGTHARFKQVKMGQLRKLDLRAERPLTIHIDGEIFAGLGTDVRQISVEILPGILEVLV